MDRRRPLIALAALTALGACNAVYDLRETRGPDSDGDRISDENDNCPLAVNFDQANHDGDAFGDACDPCEGMQSGMDRDGDGIDDLCDGCPDGSNHDEDGDGYLDGCDVCPGIVDSQDDEDGDGVGDACDASPGVMNHRVFFDGFGPPREGWDTWYQEWQPVGDEFAPVMYGGAGAWNFATEVGGEGWWVEVAVVTPPVIKNGDELGVDIRERSDGQIIMYCFADATNGTWRPNAYQNETITLGPVSRFRLRYLGGIDALVECAINGMVVPDDPSSAGPNETFLPSLHSRMTASHQWIDVVAGP